ncbi:MAG TPA: hypothetical protein VF364_00935 [Candidatus Limnocylindria bacterium]
MLIWSERRGPRMREVAADVATLAWLALWLSLGARLYGLLAELAGAGRLIRDGGLGLRDTGGEVAQAVQGIPLVGEGAASRLVDAFGATAQPIIQFGSDLERLLVIVAALLGIIVVAIAVIPWMNRYLPWRLDRLRGLNAGARAIRRGDLAGSGVDRARELDQLLASRALHRLEYATLLDFTPDPFGDWKAGRLDGLVQAELDTVGLRRVRGRRAGG